uniref:Striatin, calmodulin binding protein n=2 Tax=Takifugu rubripes TaxID=31033 RepID=A0A674P874_TAKRU
MRNIDTHPRIDASHSCSLSPSFNPLSLSHLLPPSSLHLALLPLPLFSLSPSPPLPPPPSPLPLFPSTDDGNNSPPSPLNSSHQLGCKQGCQLLSKYLQEVGYTGTILDVKSHSVRALLGLTVVNPSESRPEPMINSTKASSPKDGGVKPDPLDRAAAFRAFKFIERRAAEFSIEDDSEDRDKSIHEPAEVRRGLLWFLWVSSMKCEQSEFDVSLPRPSIPWPSDGGRSSPLRELSWDVDQGLIAELKEKYRKERKGKKGVKRPNCSNLQEMLANLQDTEDISPLQPPSRPTASKVNDEDLGRSDDEPMTFLPSTGKCFILGRVDEAVSNEFGLGELARITVANEVDNLTFENNKDALRKTWNPKFTLRSHFDSVRNLAFHPVEPVLVTASEDQTVKLWNLQKTVPAKKCAALDVEPIYTFRAHSGAVLSVTMSSSGEQCFSGGVDGTIQSWNTPEANTDPYDSYEPSVLRGALYGHTDAVWGLAYSSAHQRLLSCSADGTLRLWDATNTSPSLTVFNERGELGCPTSVDLVSSNPDHMVVSFTSGDLVLFNMETQQLLLKMEANASCHINKVLSHPTLPVTITAQDDRNIRFFDNNTGHLIHSMVAHLDEVTCLAVDPNGLYLMSGSHDCSIRLWNMESRTCIQEFTAHRRKFHESIHDVAFHPTKCYVGSAGADALAKVFV